MKKHIANGFVGVEATTRVVKRNNPSTHEIDAVRQEAVKVIGVYTPTLADGSHSKAIGANKVVYDQVVGTSEAEITKAVGEAEKAIQAAAPPAASGPDLGFLGKLGFE